MLLGLQEGGFESNFVNDTEFEEVKVEYKSYDGVEEICTVVPNVIDVQSVRGRIDVYRYLVHQVTLWIEQQFIDKKEDYKEIYEKVVELSKLVGLESENAFKMKDRESRKSII